MELQDRIYYWQKLLAYYVTRIEDIENIIRDLEKEQEGEKND